MNAINNVIILDLSKIIKDFENFTYKGYVRKRPKREPTDSYFYLAIHIAKCMMRSDEFNLHVGPVRTEITGIQKIPISHVCDSDKSKPKGIIADKKLLKVCSTDKSESESVIFDESSTEDSESESVHRSISTNKENMQLMKQITRNLWLQIIQSSTSNTF